MQLDNLDGKLLDFWFCDDAAAIIRRVQKQGIVLDWHFIQLMQFATCAIPTGQSAAGFFECITAAGIKEYAMLTNASGVGIDIVKLSNETPLYYCIMQQLRFMYKYTGGASIKPIENC